MLEVTVNYWAVLAGAVASVIIGALWYSPMLFANVWLKATGKTKEEQSGAGKSIALMVIGALLVSCIMARFVAYAGATTAATGMIIGFWAWLGFSFTTAWATTVFETKNWTLFALTAGYHLVEFLVVGAILAVWS